jgi:hypothetical protein
MTRSGSGDEPKSFDAKTIGMLSTLMTLAVLNAVTKSPFLRQSAMTCPFAAVW